MDNTTLPCWNENATCDNCERVLPENQTMIYTLTDSTVMGCAASIITVFGFLLNLLIILSLLSKKGVRQQITSTHILSVLFADLMCCTFNLPILSIRFLTRQSEFYLSKTLCTIFPIMFYVNLGAFVLSLMCVTINRTCILYLQENATKYIKWKAQMVSVFLCWFLPVLAMILPVSEAYGKIGVNGYTQSCSIVEKDGKSPEKLLYNLFIFIPSLVMIICNVIIFIKLKRHSALRDPEAIRFILGILSVFLFFLVTLIPAWAVNYIDDCVQYPQARTIAYILVWTRTIFDPLVFLGMEESYRDAVRGFPKRLVKACKKKDESEKRESAPMRLKTLRFT